MLVTESGIVTLARLVQDIKVQGAMLVSEAGSETLVRLEQV